jgi:hypothetical protein
MPILNYTTKINEHKTVSEIQSILSRKGANRVSIEYVGGSPEAVVFEYQVQGNAIPFRLPCKFEGVRKAMLAEVPKVSRSKRDRDPAFAAQARRVAWRIIKDWIAAQLALIEAGQAELAEVFFPYVVVNASGKTLYEEFKADGGHTMMALAANSPRLLTSGS